jgi:hypothetical protein
MTGDRGRAADAILAILLFGAAAVYLASFPRSLNHADESYFLYESVRIRNGEVMYRDIFQFVTPLASYLMALLFWLFGTSIGTAHLATAALHGLTVALLFCICRRLEIRREIAVATSLAYLAVCQPTWPYASPHWFSTQAVLWIVLALITARWHGHPRGSVPVGIAAGVLAGIQQQKGVVMAAGVVAIFVADHLVRTRLSNRAPALPQRLLYFVAGLAAVVLPLLVVCVAVAGIEPVYEALVRFPLVSYPNTLRVGWGRLNFLAKPYAELTFPIFLRWLPLVLIPMVGRWCWYAVTATGQHQQRMLSVLIVTAAASAVSILYYPDLIHIAFIAPVFLLCIAQTAQWALERVARTWAAPVAGLLAVATLLVLVPRLASNYTRAWWLYPVSHDTAFGRLDFSGRFYPALNDEVQRRLEDVPGREIYAYPNFSGIYLTAAANNPTPFQFFIASQSPAEHTRRVLSILHQRSLPYVIGVTLFMKPQDPVVRYIEENYEPVSVPGTEGVDEFPVAFLYRRKDLAEPASVP